MPPKFETMEEFIKYYSFADRYDIYRKGEELIPVNLVWAALHRFYGLKGDEKNVANSR